MQKSGFLTTRLICLMTSLISFLQSFVWSYGGQSTIGPRVPFVVDMSKSTFEYLDELLGEVCEGMEGQSDWPPPQEKECMAVAGLNLLNLQVGFWSSCIGIHSFISHL